MASRWLRERWNCSQPSLQDLREVCRHLRGVAQSPSSSGLDAETSVWLASSLYDLEKGVYVTGSKREIGFLVCFRRQKSCNPPSLQNCHFQCLMHLAVRIKKGCWPSPKLKSLRMWRGGLALEQSQITKLLKTHSWPAFPRDARTLCLPLSRWFRAP